MEPTRDRFKTIVYNVDEDGVMIPDEQMSNYLITIKHKPIYERCGKRTVHVIRYRTVRKSGQQQIEFPGDGGIPDQWKPV